MLKREEKVHLEELESLKMRLAQALNRESKAAHERLTHVRYFPTESEDESMKDETKQGSLEITRLK